MMRQKDVREVLDGVPDYEVFFTVDELSASTRQLTEQYPGVVEILPVGRSRRGESIEAVRIGHGSNVAILFAMPHPNEPIGSMMLEYLSRRLAEDDALREALDYTWYLIKCIDPDGTRLNEGWFKGPFSITHYARHYYRPPSFQQVEWTFPVDYKTLHFHDPLPETQALMTLIEQVRPRFIYSLHNSGFGGTYFYISEEAPSLAEPFYQLVESQGLPLHLGEPEIPYATEYAQAIFKVPLISETYDFLAAQIGGDPADFLRGGTSSFDYARQFGAPFCLVCEMPYFYNPAIRDTSAGKIVRREAILQSAADGRQALGFLQEQYDTVRDELTVASPFRESIAEALRVLPANIAAQENWARTDPRTAEMATVAEEFDSRHVTRFYRLLRLGLFLRMLAVQVEATGESAALSAAQGAVQAAFDAHGADLEATLAYSVIPIQKLVRVQLGSALLAAAHAAGRRP